MSAFISAISYYLPETKVSNQDLVEQFPEWSVDKIAKKIGVMNRHTVKEGQCASDLAEQAAKRLFLEHDIDKDKVDFLLLCTQSPDYFLPTTACLLQSRLKLNNKCGALDFNLGCSGYVYGLALAKGLIESHVANNVLLLTAETYTKYIHRRDKGNTNHCLDNIGSTTQLFLSECPTEWMIFSCLMKLPSLLIFSNNFSRQTKRSRPTNSPHFSFIVASLLKMIGISKPYFLPMIKSFGSWAGVHFIAPVPNSTST